MCQCNKGTNYLIKSFSALEKQAYKHFVDPIGAQRSQKKAAQKLAGPPKMSKTKSIIVLIEEDPIIIVPAAVQSMMSLYNITDFLINQKYQPLIQIRTNR